MLFSPYFKYRIHLLLRCNSDEGTWNYIAFLGTEEGNSRTRVAAPNTSSEYTARCYSPGNNATVWVMDCMFNRGQSVSPQRQLFFGKVPRHGLQNSGKRM